MAQQVISRARPSWLKDLSVPVIAAPMFLVSGYYSIRFSHGIVVVCSCGIPVVST